MKAFLLLYFLLSLSFNLLLSKQKTIYQQHQSFTSYHPYLLHSFSYPNPITPHLYLGCVLAFTPVFLTKDQALEQPSQVGFKVNGKITLPAIQSSSQTIQTKPVISHQKQTTTILQFIQTLWQTQTSYPTQQLKVQSTQQVIRHMVVLQVQSSLTKQVPFKTQFVSTPSHYLIACYFNHEVVYYSIFLQSQKQYQIGKQITGMKINVRNESYKEAENNWKYSFDIEWKGFSNIEGISCNHCKGLVFQIQHRPEFLEGVVYFHFKEITLSQFISLRFLTDISSYSLKTLININYKDNNSQCAEKAVQKLFQGLSFAFGTLQMKNGSIEVINEPLPLLSFTPSRVRFPWGFLWDDGFHCQVAMRWNERTALTVIKSWLDTMLDNGWIPRQQNRGSQRQFLCNCPKFMVKDLKDGNPPTLLFSLEYLFRKNKLTEQTFPKKYYMKLKKWYNWFNSTQSQSPHIYAWHDSIQQRNSSLTSGMDDFPRPSSSFGNIDLQSWMYFFASFLANTSYLYNLSSEPYLTDSIQIKSNLIHFEDDTSHKLMDIGEDMVLSTEFGYPSLLPIAFGMLEYHSLSYNATIKAVKDELDVDFGLSSLSKFSPHYFQEENAYWRGPVWININYLFLKGIALYYPQEKQLYDKIRTDILATVCTNYQESGFFYQNYINFKGSFSRPFNGWTSLVSIIHQQNY